MEGKFHHWLTKEWSNYFIHWFKRHGGYNQGYGGGYNKPGFGLGHSGLGGLGGLGGYGNYGHYKK